MSTIYSLNYFTLFDICAYLVLKDFLNLTSTSKYFQGLRLFNDQWKSFCWKDFALRYNHPDQSYLDLYKHCFEIKRSGGDKRLPCRHLCATSQLPLLFHGDIAITNETDSIERFTARTCERCYVTGPSKLFLCLSKNCQRTFCEEHARKHANVNRTGKTTMHLIFYKLNMSELFCQLCIDWIGGYNADLAEQYQASLITDHWFEILAKAYNLARTKKETKQSPTATIDRTGTHSSSSSSSRRAVALLPPSDNDGDNNDERGWYTDNDYGAGASSDSEDIALMESRELLKLKTVRQKERCLQTNETFPYPAVDCKDYCFISAEWMYTWELFVEGYLTKMPTDQPIDQAAAIAGILALESQRSSFTLPGVIIASTKLWDYVSTHYTVKGKMITEDDLKSQATCRLFLERLRIWRERLEAFQY